VTFSVVLDTSVLVSAALHQEAPPGLLVQAALRRELAVFTCPGIVDEYWDVLTRPKFARLGGPPVWLQPLLEQAHHLPVDPPPWPLPGPDADDPVFLALAQRTGATLVTGNLAAFPDSIRQGVQVLSPRACLDGLA